MTQTQIRWALLSPSIRRCGATPEEFAEVLAQLAEDRTIERGTVLRTRLSAILVMRHLRKPLAEVASLYDVHPSTVRRWESEIEGSLAAGAFRSANGTCITGVDQLLAHLREVRHVDVHPTVNPGAAWSDLAAELFTMPRAPRRLPGAWIAVTVFVVAGWAARVVL